MYRRQSQGLVARGFTLIELLVVVAIIALLLSILLPSLGGARDLAKRAKCGADLSGISRAVQTCWSENNEFGPTYDDGDARTITPFPMYTWVDVLFDLRYLSDPKAGQCPSDQRPDEPARKRGGAGDWNFDFVREMGRGDTHLPGVRTSYALNAIFHFNFRQDRHSDPTRQVYAMDGWWTWFGSINAAWLYSGKVGQQRDPMQFPHSRGTMVGWRHGRNFSSEVLYVDGHVATLVPKIPKSRDDLLFVTVDTALTYSWLPGEYSCRDRDSTYASGNYKGRMPDFDTDPADSPLTGKSRAPWWYYAQSSGKGYKTVGPGYNFHPYAFPEHLSAVYRTQKSLWQELPSEPSRRY